MMYNEDRMNPIFPGLGVCDPHIHVFEDKAYLYCGHDKSADSASFCLDEWQIWSSDDMVHWTLESRLHPEQLYMGASTFCWAADAAEMDGKYYFYFSNHNKETGVAVSENPGYGFKDALNVPLLDGSLTTTTEYDPCVFVDDDGTPYIIFGGPEWCYGEKCGYYIAKMNRDMVSLAESPRKIFVNHEADDKASLNKFNSRYYLSWGAYYAISDSPYGPFQLMGNLGTATDHTSFAEWNGQIFHAFTIYDPTVYYRSTGLCYVHIKNNGELVVDPVICEYGVGQYNAKWNKIQAEWYMKKSGLTKKENPRDGFDAVCVGGSGELFYPNIYNAGDIHGICLFAACYSERDAVVQLLDDGKVIGEAQIKSTGGLRWRDYRTFSIPLTVEKKDVINLSIRIACEGSFHLDYFKFY